MIVTRDSGVIRVGRPPDRPERTALVEGRGAVLTWDVTGADRPAAEIHDPAAAADWLWEVYGVAAAKAILDGVDRVEVGAPDPALFWFAQLRWARAWWPASTLAGIPALAPELLAVEAVARTAAVEHVLEDDDAVARALAEVDDAALDAYTDGEVGSRVIMMRNWVHEIAEDVGDVPAPLPVARRDDWALAAGSAVGGMVLKSGSAPVDWTLVPSGAVDAAAGAEWTLERRPGATVLTISVAPGPAGFGELLARCGAVDVPLLRAEGVFTGSLDVDASWLAEDVAPVVFAPGFAAPERIGAPVDVASQAAVLDYARARLDDPDASLAEFEAARRR